MLQRSSLLINAFATIIIGNLINSLLHGVLTVQIYLYYLAFPNDRTWTKVVVYTTYVFETIQTIGIGTTLILILLKGVPYPTSFNSASYQSHHEYIWAAGSMLVRMFGGLVPLIAQGIYAHRIWLITQGTIIPGLIIVLAILQLSAAIVTTTASAHPSMILYVTWTGLNVINDLIIAITMTRILSEEYLSPYTKRKVNRIFYLIIATGSSTVAVNILSIILLFINAYVIRGFTGSAGAVFMPKLYANSILVMLNNRMNIRNSQDATTNFMISIISISRLNPSALVVATHRSRIGSSNSVMLCDEVSSLAPAARSSI